MLTQQQLQWIATQKGDSPIWGQLTQLVNDPKYNPEAAKAQKILDEINSKIKPPTQMELKNSFDPNLRAIGFDSNKYQKYAANYAANNGFRVLNLPGNAPKLVGGPKPGSPGYKEIEPLLNQYQNAAKTSLETSKNYYNQIDKLAGGTGDSRYIGEIMKNYRRNAFGDRGRLGEFSDAVQSTVGNFGGAVAGYFGGPLGVLAHNKLVTPNLSKGAQETIDPGLQSVSGVAGLGAAAGAEQQAAQQAELDAAANTGFDPATASNAEMGLRGEGGLWDSSMQPNYSIYDTAGNLLPNTAEGLSGAGLAPSLSDRWATNAGDSSIRGTSGGSSLSDILLQLAPSILGLIGSDKMGDAQDAETQRLRDMAARYEGYGAPYRKRLYDLYNDPESFLTSKEVQTPVQQGTNMLARSLSTQGNPAGSGNALQQLQSYSSDQLFGRLGQEKDRLAGFGGLAAYNAAAPQIGSSASGVNPWDFQKYNAIGSGLSTLNNIFNPPKESAFDKYWESRMKSGY